MIDLAAGPPGDRDALAVPIADPAVDLPLAGEPADVVELVVLFIRSGKLVGRRAFRQREQEFPDGEVVGSFVQQYYASGTFVPDQVIVPVSLGDDHELLADWLSQRRGKKVRLIHPKRGQRTKLVELASKNAESSAAARGKREQETEAMLEKLQRRLMLRRFPRRVECFDIAHIQGTETVASMVTFIDGEPTKSLYRKFKVKSVANDDFAAMREVVRRRYSRLQAEGKGFPLFVLVDGWALLMGSLAMSFS